MKNKAVRISVQPLFLLMDGVSGICYHYFEQLQI